MKTGLEFVVVGMILLCITSIPVDAGMHEKRLLAHLFNQSRWDAHNPMERPSVTEGKPVLILLKCFLNQIMDMDEKNQVLSTIIWLDMKWTDYHFRWNASEYDNIRQLNLPPGRMWKPDLILYNSASEKFDQVFPTNVIVKNTGDIVWIPPGLFHSICSVKVNWFPFDSQSCALKFGTWTYQGNTVDLKLQCDNETDFEQECNHSNEVDLSAYLAHSEWALESATVKRNVDSYGTIDQLYIDVTIYVHIQRRALYYMFNIIVPCMIMSVMSLLVFTLPPDANEKIVLGVTTLLSLTMLLQLVGDKLPQTSAGNPVLVLYFTCTIVLCSWSLVFAVVLLNCHHHTGGILHVPWLIGTLVNVWLASVLRIERHADDDEQNSSKQPNSSTAYPKNRFFSSSDSPASPVTPTGQSIAKLYPHTAPKRSNAIDGSGSAWNDATDMEVEFRPTFLIQNHVSVEQRPLRSKPIHHIELQSMVKQNAYSKQSPNRLLPTGDYFGPTRLEYSCSTETEHSRETLRRISPNIEKQPSWSSTTTTSPQKLKIIEPSHLDTSDTLTRTAINNEGMDKRAMEFYEKAMILKRLRELTKEVRYVTGRMRCKDTETNTSKEWKMACRVLDRLCLVIFAALNLFTTLGILTSAPTIIKAFTSTGAPSQPM